MTMYDKNKPFVLVEQPGVRSYCMCGLSENPPYCDGAHNGKETGVRPFLVKYDKETKVSICGCGKSSDLPYCDGAHKK